MRNIVESHRRKDTRRKRKEALSHAEADTGALRVRRRPLLHGDVLPDQTRDLVSLFRLQSRDALLHQVAALHVEVERALLGLDLPRGDHLGVRVMVQRLLPEHENALVSIRRRIFTPAQRSQREQEQAYPTRKRRAYVRNQIYKVHPVPVQSENVIGALFLALGYPLDREETRAEERPLGQDL